jgi:eukaryotic-like serine/threonine-protein kinase
MIWGSRDMATMVGSTLTHYAVEAKLGEGGMGTVYRARDTVLGRDVAIKVLSPDAAGDPDLAPRILREAKVASRLNHPNIVTVHEFGRDGDVEFIVMEYVDGRPLTQHIPPGGLPVDQVLGYAAQVADALASAHEAGLVHRDIKPGNVMVTESGRVKVVDFGLARPLPPDAAADTREASTLWLTRPDLTAGTVGYMAPEQIEGRPADARSDVFALGVVIFELLTGRQPFKRDSLWATMEATLTEDPPDLARLRPDVPPALVRIVRRAMARAPGERYASARALAGDLATIRTPPAVVSLPARPWRRRATWAALVVFGLIAVGAVGWVWRGEARLHWVRATAIPEIRRDISGGDIDGGFRLARQAQGVAPDEPELEQLWTDVSLTLPVTSDPSGAEVAVKGYMSSRAWIPLGRTPLASVAVPASQVRWRVTKPGYDPLEVSGDSPVSAAFHLTAAGTAPADMVLVPKGTVDLDTGSVDLPDFWIDTYEVTNRQFKQFIDAGGYRRRDYWKEPFIKDGQHLTWAAAMNEFRDQTGRPGPSTWNVGGYPEGQGDYPVSGVSWYEAAAYAEFAHKQLPTIYHWYRASGAFSIFSDILNASNFSGTGTARVGQYRGVGPYGTYDMAGNVKEWCWNGTGTGLRYVLGGSFKDATYEFRQEDAQSPFERRAGFGLRLMRQTQPIATSLSDPVRSVERNPSTLTPVSDAIYQVYRRQFDYDPVPLAPVVESTEDADVWRREKVSFAAAYDQQRVPAYLFIPKSGSPPYEAVVMFPGSNATMKSSSTDLWLTWADFFVRSGRVLVYPVYQGTYERRETGPMGPNDVRELLVKDGKDVRRTVDYLDSRADIDNSRIAFYGISYGAQLAPIFLAVEPRFRTGVLMSGGFETWNLPPEVDPVNYAPHVHMPVLMVNGREDFDLPYATAQVPLFNMLGTAAADKRHRTFEGGHIPAQQAGPIKAMLDWLDKYLGPVTGG